MACDAAYILGKNKSVRRYEDGNFCIFDEDGVVCLTKEELIKLAKWAENGFAE